MKAWYESKTIWLMGLGAAVTLLGSNELANVLPEEATRYIALAIFVLGIPVRFLTTGSVSVSKGEDA